MHPRAPRATLVRRTHQVAATYYPCPRAHHRTQLCFRLCKPVDGMGECGRHAGHAFLGRTQLAILEAGLEGRARRAP